MLSDEKKAKEVEAATELIKQERDNRLTACRKEVEAALNKYCCAIDSVMILQGGKPPEIRTEIINRQA